MKDGMIQLDLGAVTQPRTLFKPVSWLAKIDFINHLILFNNVLITVLSEKKGGKTCFSTLLQNNLDQQIKSVSMTVAAPCERTSIINDIATRLHLNVDENTDIHSIASQINERKAHVLLVIDNAQHLPESFIKEAMLAIKSQESFGFFHLCLVSDYSVVATLNQLAVEQFNNLIHTIEIGSLNESETRTYVLQRAMAERLITKPLSDEQFKAFYQQTKGNLAKINSSLEGFILQCSAPKKAKKAMTLKRTSAAITAAVVAGVSYMYIDMVKLPFSTETASLESKAALTVQSVQLASLIPAWTDSSTRQFVHFALPKKQILDDFDEEQNVTTVAIVDKVVVIPTVKVNSVDFDSQASMAMILESQLVKIPEFTHKVVAKKSYAKAGANKFTIQLAASHKKTDVNRFRQSNKLFANTKVRHFTNAKGTWYILTLGEYASRNQAQVQANKLPSELAKLNPWIRSVSGLGNVG